MQQLSPELHDRYDTLGFLELSAFLMPTEVAALQQEITRLAGEETPGRVLEKDGRLVRALHGCHLTSPICRRLTALPRLVGLAESVLGGPVYVHQFKVNFKAAFGGDVWPWHQDFIYWRKEDGMRESTVTNLLLFIDEVNEFNGPLMLIPGSHRHGMIDTAAKANGNAGADWEANVSADLKYSLDRATIEGLVVANGIVAPKGPAGTALLFHPNLAHASVPNLSPFNRTVLIVTYNRVDNPPRSTGTPRPEFLVSRDLTAIAPVAEDSLVASEA
jgi:ectoine hydroxylase-related dioxygenase (phytanoyl-CoA dioxygenase family)